MKKAFIIEVGLIVGSFAIAIYLLNKEKDNICSGRKKAEKKQITLDGAPLEKAALDQEKSVYEDVKRFSVKSMYSRHEDAATIIRDSATTIRKNARVSESTSNEIDEISSELDKMSSGD